MQIFLFSFLLITHNHNNQLKIGKLTDEVHSFYLLICLLFAANSFIHPWRQLNSVHLEKAAQPKAVGTCGVTEFPYSGAVVGIPNYIDFPVAAGETYRTLPRL